ncbi:hypothetical protein Kpho01_57120 [Kitasatospora phosalacinea]|uniref:Type II toxin-antitoxin system RelE/ParE family toxin n=1 Tax=Kitasatospora phosalacinea TaxID=2065 RepID=A0A9W6UPN9_9ACTN|nr:hypothetical protein Kpho01_57120 [Kitasatospora phosalacinea]
MSAVNAAARFLKDDPEGLRQLVDSVDLLAHSPRPPGSAEYGSANLRRMHVGHYRVMYEITGPPSPSSSFTSAGSAEHTHSHHNPGRWQNHPAGAGSSGEQRWTCSPATAARPRGPEAVGSAVAVAGESGSGCGGRPAASRTGWRAAGRSLRSAVPRRRRRVRADSGPPPGPSPTARAARRTRPGGAPLLRRTAVSRPARPPDPMTVLRRFLLVRGVRRPFATPRHGGVAPDGRERAVRGW